MLKLIIVVLSLGNVLFPDDLNTHGGGCCSYSILTTLFKPKLTKVNGL
jgi:hypothetical protein